MIITLNLPVKSSNRPSPGFITYGLVFLIGIFSCFAVLRIAAP